MAVFQSNRAQKGDVSSVRRKGYIERLGRYKLVWWRLGNDLFAIREMIEKARIAHAKAPQGSEKEKSLKDYLISLQSRENSMVRRYEHAGKIIHFRVLDTLTAKEYQWWRRMEPVYEMIDIPTHLSYWLGTTEKSSVCYTRIARPKVDSNGKLLWRLDTKYYWNADAIEALPAQSRICEWSYNPVCDIKDVEQEVFGKEIPF